jgi:hypothetical protein
MSGSDSRRVLADFAGKMLAPNNRGVVLDLVVFVVSLLLLRALGILANTLVHAAAHNVPAKLAVGLFFAALVFVQPLGPILKRWSFHQRTAFSADSDAGCLVFWFMFVYLVLMFALCAVAAVVLGEVFSAGPDVGVVFALGGFVWSIISVVFVYRYFVPPKESPRWTFLTTPAAAHLGDAFIYLNAIAFQILWGTVTASAPFRELVTGTPLGRPGSFSDILGRLVAIAVCALLLYFPARIFYLAEDKHRALTWATILLANLPLILRIAFTPAVHT